MSGYTNSSPHQSPALNAQPALSTTLQEFAANQLLLNAGNSANGGPDLGSVSHFLSLRVDRPVEGCTIRPRAYVYSKQYTATGMANKAYNQTDHVLQYRWLRGPERQVCANPSCPRANSFSPLDWSTYALQGSRIQCLMCHKLKVPRHRSVFCNARCFKEAWREHQHTHTALKRQTQYSGGKVAAAVAEVTAAASERLKLGKATAAAAAAGVPAPEGVNNNNGCDVIGGSGGVVNAAAVLDGAVGPECLGEDDEVVKPPGEEEAALIVESMMADQEEWTDISTEGRLTPAADDVGHCLRLECRAVLPSGQLVCPAKSVITEPVLCAPPPPPWRQLVAAPSAKAAAANAAGNVRFRVASYNLLAEIYATQSQYPTCDFWALNWGYRKTNLLRELLEAKADILCLQEVQADAYQTHFHPQLAEKGYDGLYKSKTRESMGLVGQVDGCAVFWNRSKFRVAENYAIEFNECAKRASAHMGLRADESAQFLHRLSKDNIAQVAVLESLERPRSGRMGSAQLCVVNTHLYSNPEFPDVKLWQSHALMQELEHFFQQRQLPLLVVGDFNSDPTSAVYELMTMQGVSPGHPDLSSDPCHVLPDSSELVHNIQLQSTYATALGAEPEYTNYTRTFKGVLDYIWYSPGQLRPLAVAPMPTPEEIHKSGDSLPNVQSSSDHIMLIADFTFASGLGVSHSPLFQPQKNYYGK